MPGLLLGLGQKVAELRVEGIAAGQLRLRYRRRVTVDTVSNIEITSTSICSVSPMTLEANPPGAQELHQVLEPSLLQSGLHGLEALLHQNAARLRCLNAGAGNTPPRPTPPRPVPSCYVASRRYVLSCAHQFHPYRVCRASLNVVVMNVERP